MLPGCEVLVFRRLATLFLSRAVIMFFFVGLGGMGAAKPASWRQLGKYGRGRAVQSDRLVQLLARVARAAQPHSGFVPCRTVPAAYPVTFADH